MPNTQEDELTILIIARCPFLKKEQIEEFKNAIRQYVANELESAHTHRINDEYPQVYVYIHTTEGYVEISLEERIKQLKEGI